MSTKNKRYMIVIDQKTEEQLKLLKKFLGTKQTSKIFKKLINKEYNEIKELIENIINL